MTLLKHSPLLGLEEDDRSVGTAAVVVVATAAAMGRLGEVLGSCEGFKGAVMPEVEDGGTGMEEEEFVDATVSSAA